MAISRRTVVSILTLLLLLGIGLVAANQVQAGVSGNVSTAKLMYTSNSTKDLK